MTDNDFVKELKRQKQEDLLRVSNYYELINNIGRLLGIVDKKDEEIAQLKVDYDMAIGKIKGLEMRIENLVDTVKSLETNETSK